MFKESLQMAWQNICQHKMRSFLTSLGIIIGVMAIVSLITIVQGVTDQVDQQFTDLGVNRLSVQVMGTPVRKGLSESELEEIKSLPNVAAVTPTFSAPAKVMSNQQVIDVQLEGRGSAYFDENATALASGRAITPIDEAQQLPVALVNEAFLAELVNPSQGIGETIQINGYPHTIVGVLSDESTGLFSRVDSDDPQVMTSSQQFMTVTKQRQVNAFDIYVEVAEASATTGEVVSDYLDQIFNYQTNRFLIQSMDSVVDTMESTTGMMTSMLLGIASISLVVGGIGIMNMMLVSVSERTSEIGLRKALGARPKIIQIQFLLEAVILSFIGGIFGLILGAVVAYATGILMGFPLGISWSSVALAIGFSSVVGIVFGWSPAKRASSLSPIEALRSL